MSLAGAASVTAGPYSLTAAAAVAAGLLQPRALSQVRTALAAVTAVTTLCTTSACKQLHSSSTLLPPPYSSLQHAYLPRVDPGHRVLAADGVHRSIKMPSVTAIQWTRGILGSSSSSSRSMPFSNGIAAASRRSTEHPGSDAVDEPASHPPPRKHRKAASAAEAAATPSESAADAVATPSLSEHQQPAIKPSHAMIRSPRKALGLSTQQAGEPDSASSAATPAAVDAVQPSSTRGARQPGHATQPGLLQLTGTEQQLFAQVLNYMPPQATAELVEVAEVSRYTLRTATTTWQLPPRAQN